MLEIFSKKALLGGLQVCYHERIFLRLAENALWGNTWMLHVY